MDKGMIVDIIIVVVALLSIIIGIMRGFVREVLSLIAWVLSFWIAYNFADRATPVLEPWINDPMVRHWAAFLALFVLALIGISIVSFLIRRLLSLVGISGVDRSLGAVFGFLRGVVIVAAVVTLIRASGANEQNILGNSRLKVFFEPVVKVMVDLLPSGMARPSLPSVIPGTNTTDQSG